MKKEHKEKIEQRLQLALRNLYHNATPAYIRIDDDNLASHFQDWFNDAASFEIEYIQNGLGMTAGEYEKQRKLGFAHNERYFWLVSQIVRYGKLYTYGRGGRTLAPDKLISGGVYWNIRKGYFDDCAIADKVEAIEILEAFNQYVTEWNSKENLLAMWQYEAERMATEKTSEAVSLRLEFAEIANDLRLTQLNKQGAIFAILRDTLREKYRLHKQTIKELVLWQAQQVRSA